MFVVHIPLSVPLILPDLNSIEWINNNNNNIIIAIITLLTSGSKTRFYCAIYAAYSFCSYTDDPFIVPELLCLILALNYRNFHQIFRSSFYQFNRFILIPYSFLMLAIIMLSQYIYLTIPVDEYPIEAHLCTVFY